ncbi:hypothetical protein GCM10023213_18670 [Prosthecobacter algae]|uniref:LemA protein n=1 Tax=Prosthecobacter algae TaxID=1144682 RepID=A0ABP9P2F1_9BACT
MQKISPTSSNYPWQGFLLLVITPFLTGCFEISKTQGQTQVLIQERLEVEKQIPIYDQHIAYYQSQLHQGTKITGGVDPYYDTLNAYLQKVETALVETKVKMAGRSAYLNILREESSRQHSLQPQP